MVIETIVGGIISALTWKAAGKAAEKTGEAIVENRGAILEKVRNLLKGEELTKLNLLEDYPDSDKLQTEVKEILTPRLQENPAAAKEIETLLEKSGLSFQVKRNEMKVKGDKNISLQDVSGSSININRK